MSRILIALEWLPLYRVEFLDEVVDTMSSLGHDIRVVHGSPPSSVSRRGTAVLPGNANRSDNRTFRLGRFDVVYQPVVREANRADLVVVQQESSLLLNLLLAAGLVRPRRWAMWGHGQHFNPHDVSRVAEGLKAWETRRSDWFFAYTERSREAAIVAGADPERITVVRNTTVEADPGQGSEEARAIRDDLMEANGSVVALVSSLDRWKRLPFLRESMELLHALNPDVIFLVIGGGEGLAELETWAQSRVWVRLTGPRFGADKACIMEAVSLTVHPGLAGLHVVDSFRHRAPMVTTELEYHSHEFSYLKNGVNSLILPSGASPAEYAEAVRSLLSSPSRLADLRSGCESELEDLTIEKSAERFCGGLEQALAGGGG